MTAPARKYLDATEAPPGLDDVLDVDGAAALLKVGRDAIYVLVGKNAIPHRRVGKVIRMSRSALLRWLDAPTYKEPDGSST